MNSSAVMLGGPRHGERWALPENASRWNTIQPPDLTRWTYVETMADCDRAMALDTISCEVVNLAVGQHTVKAIRWPDVKADTAKRLLADYVLAAFEGYDITHGKGR